MGSTGKMRSGEGVPLPKTSPSGGREESVPEERAGQERSEAPWWKTFKLLFKKITAGAFTKMKSSVRMLL